MHCIAANWQSQFDLFLIAQCWCWIVLHNSILSMQFHEADNMYDFVTGEIGRASYNIDAQVI